MSSKIKQAVILAGGKGTRLRPYTVALPKPLMPVGDLPILAVILKQLKQAGFLEVVISTGHLAELIRAYFQDGRALNLHIRYVREDVPLSTAGALKIIKGLDENFLVMNGDILTTLNYRRLCDFHAAHESVATIAVHRQDIQIDYGVIELDSVSQMKHYSEKPILKHYVSMGVNVLKREAVRFIKTGEALGMPDLLVRLQSHGHKVWCYRNSAQWFDIGRVEEYQQAQDYFDKFARRVLKDSARAAHP